MGDFKNGMRRLGIAVGILAAIISFLKIASESQGPEQLPVALVVSGVIGLLAWGVVRLIAWVVRGFLGSSSPR